LRELLFAIVKDWLLLLSTNSCDVQEDAFNWNNNTNVFCIFLYNYMQSTSGTTGRDVKHINRCHSNKITSGPCVADCSGNESEKTTVPIDAYPSSFVSERKRYYEINGPQIILVMFVCYFVSGVRFLR